MNGCHFSSLAGAVGRASVTHGQLGCAYGSLTAVRWPYSHQHAHHERPRLEQRRDGHDGAVRPAVVLLMAKAPIAGDVKTRLAATVGNDLAAQVAAAALLDTLEVCERVFPAGRRYLALSGDLDRAHQSSELHQQLLGWIVLAQHGDGLGARITNAHRDTHAHAAAPVVQIGMDTPHLDAGVLAQAAQTVVTTERPVLGMAQDGGWWLLATSSAADVLGLAEVPMSTSQTGAATLRVLGPGQVSQVPMMRDVDDADDAHYVAATAPASRFGRAWAQALAQATTA